MKLIEGICYSPSGDPVRSCDLYLPEGECRATLVFFHGGGLEGGSRKGSKDIMTRFAAHGVAAVCADYRMYPDAGYPDFLYDAAEAVQWTFSHAKEYSLGGKVFVGGSSAGAYLSLMLCFDEKYLKSVGLSPAGIGGFLFNAGAPLKHHNILKQHGEDMRACRIDESCAAYHVCGAQPDRPLFFLWADHDMPCRAESNRLMLALLRQNGYDMDKVAFREMTGYKHCGYDHKTTEDGESLLVSLMLPFIEKWAE